MGGKSEIRAAALMAAGFLACFHLPVGERRFDGAVLEALALARWYAREHVLLCLVPAFFIAGAIGVFVSQGAVLRYLGPKAPPWLAYAVASVSGTVLAVCSCTVLPLFAGIYMRGAGLGPAAAFLYAGPAINVLAIVLTARILGWDLGVARAVGAILFSVVVGAAMQFLFRRSERERARAAADAAAPDADSGPPSLGGTVFFFAAMIGVLVFANWARPASESGVWHAVFSVKWPATAVCGALLGLCLWRLHGVRPWMVLLAALPPAFLAFSCPSAPEAAFTAGAAGLAALTFAGGRAMAEWREQSWSFAKQILPLLLAGVMAAGFFLGGPDRPDAGVIPSAWVRALVGDSPAGLLALLGAEGAAPKWLAAAWPLWTNLFASLAGALMYFATLTEVPILRGLLDSGMGRGPALALLLAGPALSLPSILVINTVIGPRKTLAFVSLVVAMATLSGLLFGALF